MRTTGDIKWFSSLNCCMSRGQSLSGNMVGRTAAPRRWTGALLPHSMERNNVEIQPLTKSCTTDMICMLLAPYVYLSYFNFSFAIEALRLHGLTCVVQLRIHEFSIEKLSLIKPFSYKLKTTLS